jgi:hypothetical protein
MGSYIVRASLIYQFDGVSKLSFRLGKQMAYEVKLVYEKEGWPITLRDYSIQHRQLVIGTIDLASNVLLRPRAAAGEFVASCIQS